MDSVVATKSKKKNKLFPCFRAAASGGHVRTVRGKNDPDEQVSPFMFMEERNGMMLHNVRPLDGGDDIDSGHRKKKGGGGALSRTLKAVLFGTSLAKKIRKRKAKQKQYAEAENYRHQAPSTITNRSRIASDLNFRNSSTCSSRTSAPFSRSSFCSSSPSSEISDISFRFYPTASNRLFRQINLKNLCSGWFLLLVCLLSLILCGKAIAIACTSVWILCLCRRRIGFKSPDDTTSAAAMIAGEYKKRITMEGFLKRGRSSAQNSISSIG